MTKCPQPITIFSSDKVQNEKNCQYPHKIEVSDRDTFRSAVSHDFVCAQYKNNYRKNKNFLWADCLPIDFDNDADSSLTWITPQDISDLFQGVEFYVQYSRNHMKRKAEKSPRPRFHVVFPISKVTSLEDYDRLKKLCLLFAPMADDNATDSARLMYGTPDGEVDYFPGDINLTEFFEQHKGIIAATEVKQETVIGNGQAEYINNEIGQPIECGERNSTLSAFAFKMLKRYGNDTDDAHNLFMRRTEDCKEPLEEQEINDIWNSAVKGFTEKILTNPNYISPEVYERQLMKNTEIDFADLDSMVPQAVAFIREKDIINNSRYPFDDIGAGYLLADFVKPYARPLSDSRKWVTFDGRRWTGKNGFATVAESAKAIGIAMGIYAGDLNDTQRKQVYDWARKWASEDKRGDYIRGAQTVFPVSFADFDKDPFILNLKNGTLNLQTFDLKPHNPDDLLMKLAPVDYRPEIGVCQRWVEFIDEVMEPHSEKEIGDPKQITKEKAEFFQRYLGYSLTGDTKEDSFLTLYGPTTRNGKSVCMNTIDALMGDYSKVINAQTIMKSNFKKDGSAASPDVAQLAGIRMAIVSELPQDGVLNTSEVKTYTGDSAITARPLYSEPITFVPQFKLFLHTNYLPTCSDLTLFESDRVKILPFTRHFNEEEQDKNLKSTFREPQNQSGILNWMIEGLKKYQDKNTGGLKVPESIKAATKEYYRDSDRISRFIDEALCRDDKGVVATPDLYSAYRQWCRDNGQYSESKVKFRKGLTAKGLVIDKGKVGVSVRERIIGYSLVADYAPGYSYA